MQLDLAGKTAIGCYKSPGKNEWRVMFSVYPSLPYIVFNFLSTGPLHIIILKLIPHILGCCKRVEKMQNVRLDGIRILITQLPPN